MADAVIYTILQHCDQVENTCCHQLVWWQEAVSERNCTMVKTATFEALLESVVEDGDGWLFTLEGKTYRLADKDEVRRIAESHGYILIY